MADWVTIKTFSSRIEAELAKGYLEHNGIVSTIQADDVGGLRPHLALATGVRLLVEEVDARRARAILEDASSDV